MLLIYEYLRNKLRLKFTLFLISFQDFSFAFVRDICREIKSNVKHVFSQKHCFYKYQAARGCVLVGKCFSHKVDKA